MNIYKKLMNVQSKLKAPKGQYNAFGKYKYRNSEDILEAVKPLLLKNNLVLTITDDPVIMGDRHYIQATAAIIDADSGETLSVKAYAREAAEKKGMAASQETGAASTYARKYALNGLFCIDDTKDADTETPPDTKDETDKHQQKDSKKIIPMHKTEATISIEQQRSLYASGFTYGFTEEEIKRVIKQLYKKDSAKQLTEKEYESLKQRMKTKCEAQKLAERYKGELHEIEKVYERYLAEVEAMGMEYDKNLLTQAINMTN